MSADLPARRQAPKCHQLIGSSACFEYLGPFPSTLRNNDNNRSSNCNSSSNRTIALKVAVTITIIVIIATITIITISTGMRIM